MSYAEKVNENKENKLVYQFIVNKYENCYFIVGA